MEALTPSQDSPSFPDGFPRNPLKHPKDEDLEEGIDVTSELEQINNMKRDWKKVNKLTDLAFKLPDNKRKIVLDQAIQIVETYDRDKSKFDFIKEVASVLSEGQLAWALDLTSQIDHPMEKSGYEGWSQSELFAILSYRFSGKKRREIEQKAIEAADRHTFYFTRGFILEKLNQLLPVTYYPTLLDLAVKIDNEWGDYTISDHIKNTIQANCSKWEQLYETREEQHQALFSILRITNQNPRWVMMAVLEDLLPIISRLGGENAIAEAFISAFQVNECWP
jgi:hypothetical protein